MQIIKDNFNEEKHKQALNEFQERLEDCGYEVYGQITKVVIDPISIAGITALAHVEHKEKKDVFIGNYLRIVVAIDKTVLRVYDLDNNQIEVIASWPTKKGFRSKMRDFEEFYVDQNLALSTKSLHEIKKYVSKFNVWKGLSKKG